MLGMLLLMLGNGLQGTLLGVRGSLESIDSATMGYIMAAYFVGFLGGSRLTPQLLQRVGHVRVFAAFGSLVSAAFILYAAVVDPIAWWFLRLVVGFCFSGIYVVAESWLNHSATNETRGQTLSLYLIVQMAGMVLGQLLLNVADPAGYDLFVLITVLVSISFAPMLLSSTPAPLHQTSRAMSLKEVIKTSPLASYSTFLLGGVFATLYAMAPIYATQRGLSIADTSYFITAIFLGGMLFQFPIGWLSDRFDRRMLIIGVATVAAVAGYVGMLFGDSLPALVGCALVLGGMANPLYSLLVAYANDYLEVDQMSAAAGGLLFINGFGAMTGPVIVGFLMSHFGIEWFFIYIVLLMSAIALYGVYRMTQRPYVVVDEQAPYLPISSRTSPATAQFAINAAEDDSIEAQEAAEEVFESRPYDNAILRHHLDIELVTDDPEDVELPGDSTSDYEPNRERDE